MSMTETVTMTGPPATIVGGVDTHKDQHHAAVIDLAGRILGSKSFAASAAGYRALLAWMVTYGVLARVGIEGTSSYGMNLTRHLVAHDVTVIEVNRPNRQARRRNGKSDPADAEAAARAALNGEADGTPKRHDDSVESIRLLRIVRRSAITDRTAVINQIRTIINVCPETLRAELAKLTAVRLAPRCSKLRPGNDLAQPATAARHALRMLGQRLVFHDRQISQLDAELAVLVTAVAPELVDQFGVGIDTAGALLVAAGANAERLHSEAAFAALCGVSPVDASSGKQQRHRLNRAGNREANSALWRITIVRMCHHQPTRDYVTRRTAQGKTKKEIIRCIKRYIARQLFPHLPNLTGTAP